MPNKVPKVKKTPKISKAYTVKKIDGFQWKEVNGVIVQSYKVYWTGYPRGATREVAADITAASILEFWQNAKRAVKEFDKKRARGIRRRQPAKVARYRAALDLMDQLRELKRPGVVALGEEGFPAEHLYVEDEEVVVVEPDDCSDSEDDEDAVENYECVVEPVDYVDSYKWKQIPESMEIEHSYKVHWKNSNKITRENHLDIAPDLIKSYWELVNASIKKPDRSQKAQDYKKAFKAAEKLRALNRRGVLLPEMHGARELEKNALIVGLDARIDAQLKEIENHRKARLEKSQDDDAF